MTVPVQGQFQTPAPLHAGWGQRLVEHVATPAENTPLKYVAPAGYLTRIVSLCATFHAGPGGSNREVGIKVLEPNGNALAIIPWTTAVTLGNTVPFTFMSGIAQPFGLVNIGVVVPIPPILMEPEYYLESKIEVAGAGDQWSKIYLQVEQFEQVPSHPYRKMVGEQEQLEKLEQAVNVAAQ